MSPLTAQVVTLKIDGQDVSAHEDDSILKAAREHGVSIPTLCNLDGLKTMGSCRLCLVEMAGSPRLLPACTTKVSEGMQVITSSERINKYRRMVIELLFVEGNHICAVCVSNGHCELQSMATTVGMDHASMPYLYPKRYVDASHERFTVDHNRCILCTRCVRVCDEIEGAHTWDVMGRGTTAKVITDMNQPWGTSDTCTSCGKCVHVCPTGALFEKRASVSEMLKRRHFLPYLTMMREEME